MQSLFKLIIKCTRTIDCCLASVFLKNFEHFSHPTWCYYFKGTVMQIKKALISDRLRDLKVSGKLRIPTVYNFAVIYP